MWRLIFLICLWAMPVIAQEDGRDYLTSLIEDNLSSAGRKVTITGFAGALSSKARLDSLTIADDAGVWISLADVELDWTRSDLLRGRLTVNTLTAGEIHLFRMPIADPTMQVQASSFALPELPVSINIGSIVAQNLILDAPVLGQALTARITADLMLADGQGSGHLALERTDQGPKASATVAVQYRNADSDLVVDMNIAEAAGGILAQLLQVPNTPALQFTAKGAGPLSDFAAAIDLSSDGVSRLSGEVSLTGQGGGATAFKAALSGDMAPLFSPKYHAFFGDKLVLSLDGQRTGRGEIEVTQLNILADALSLSGQLTLAADGLPERFALRADILDPSGMAVLVPLSSDQETRIASAKMTADFDRAKGQDWQAQISVSGLDRADIQIAQIGMIGAGEISRDALGRQFSANITFSAEGMQPQSVAIGAAFGSVIWGDADLIWRDGDGGVTLANGKLSGDGYQVQVQGDIAGLGQGFPVQGSARLNVQDIARFSRLSGRNLSGGADISLNGTASLLTGAFDLTATVLGQDLTIGVTEIDGILSGASQIDAVVQRDQNGLQLRNFAVTTTGLTASANGVVTPTTSQLNGRFAMNDLRNLGARYRGDVQGDLTYDGSLTNGTLRLLATAQGLQIGQRQADRILGAKTQLDVSLVLQDAQPRLDRLTLSNSEIQLTARGNDAAFDISASLRDLGIILPEFPGGLRLSGQAVQNDLGQVLDLKVTGPAGIDATLKGQFSTGRDNDLRILGTAQAAIANAFITPRSLTGGLNFALDLKGPLAVSSLSGQLGLQQGRFADPSVDLALSGIALQVDLANGRAMVNGDANVLAGGSARIAGSIGLSAPYPSDLRLGLSNVGLRNPDLFETDLSGQIQITGPVLGGALIAGTIDLGRTEIQVPSTSFAATARLTSLTHIYADAAVRATRTYAYGAARQSGQTASAYNLDLRLRAPNRVFIRGRGLTAELAGEIQLRGTTQNVRPSGGFNLIQGRFEFLGKRLTLDEVDLQMEDRLVPTIYIRATTKATDITSTVTIEGPAIDPEITLSSSPELPQEEVLAQLLFDQNIQNLSALEAVQLAGAIATLAGQGGEGVIGRMRQALRLDDLDLQTDDTGATMLILGKYLTDKTYSQAVIAPNGQHEIDLNFAINQRLNVNIGAALDGNANMGFVIQNNY
jgi:translocation and assembly module TamB